MKMTDLVSWILRCCPARLGLIATVILMSLSAIAPEVQARTTVTSSPPPESSSAQGGSPQGVEGSENLVLPNGIFNIRGDLKVSGTDSLPNPTNTIGTGNLLDVVQSAADVWDTAFPDLPDINIGVGWADFGEAFIAPSSVGSFDNLNEIEIDGIVAFYIPAEQYPEDLSVFPDNFTVGSFPSDGLILFNSQLQTARISGRPGGRPIQLFLDGDLTPDSLGNYPNNDSAFGPLDQFERSRTDRDFGLQLGPEAINVERSSFGNFSTDAFVIDLFTVALHELQHGFGLTRANPVATNKINNGILTAGDFQIPTTFIEEDDDVHISLSLPDPSDPSRSIPLRTPVADAFVNSSERKCPTGVDIVATAEVAGQTNFDLNPCKTLVTQTPQPEPVPEPSAVAALMAIGSGGLLRGRKLLKNRTTR
jgi:hypothetical protein